MILENDIIGTVGVIPLITLAVLAIGGLVVVFTRLTPKAEVIVSFFWITVALNATVFSQLTISGLLYPFYLALLLVVFLRLFLGCLRFDARLLWILGGFVFIVLISFFSTSVPVDHDVLQEVIALLLCPLIVLALGTRPNLWATAAGAVCASAAISVWVWVNAAQGGFQYRGNIPTNENDAALSLGLGLVATLALALGLKGRRAWRIGPLILIMAGVMTYALILLASRGMTSAFGLALAGIFVQLVRFDIRKLWIVGLVIAMAGASLLLPGGDGLLQRFEGESIESAGDRTPIWRATIESYADGTAVQLLFGHGFNGSTLVVRAAMGTLSSTHNTALAVLYDFGAIGLILFIAIHFYGMARAALNRRPGAIVAAGLIWFLLGSGLTSAAHTDFMYWIALGIALALATSTKVEGLPQQADVRPDRLTQCVES